jgi:hypothetical protein
MSPSVESWGKPSNVPDCCTFGRLWRSNAAPIHTRDDARASLTYWRLNDRAERRHLPPLQAHDDGPKSGALVPSPIVDPHHTNACLGAPRLCPLLEMTQDCIVTGRHANALQQSFAWAAADPMAKQMNKFRGPPGSACKRRSNVSQLLHKRVPLINFVATSPASHAKLHCYARALRRHVLEMTLMPAVPAG